MKIVVKLLEELKKRTTVYISMLIDDENQRLFGKAGYCGRWDCQSYDSDSKILFVSHTQKLNRRARLDFLGKPKNKDHVSCFSSFV